MTRFAPVGAALLAALAAWISRGTIAFAAADGPRIAVLPLTTTTIAIIAAAALGVIALWRAGASLMPTTLLALVFLPWLPFGVPPAFLLWVDALAWTVWIAVFLLMVQSLPRRWHMTLLAPRAIAAIAALLIFSVSAWRVAPMIPGGDEPHYLVIAQSLLIDRDLTIEDVHRRGDYRAYYAGDLPPHVQRRGQDGRIYSVHAPGLPALVAPAFALGGYRGVVAFLVILAAAASALAWHVAWLATRREDAAWFGWAAVTLPVTAIFQSFTIYPDGLGGAIALTGVWALLRSDDEANNGATRARPWLWHGAALALLPWLHTRFAVLACGLGALILLRLSSTKNPAAKAVAFLSIPAVSAILWVGFFVAIYGTPDPSAPYGPGEIGSFRFVPGGLGGLLFDQRFGVVTYAPVLAFAFAGLAAMLMPPASRRLGTEMLFVIVPYLLTVTHFAMWWGGWSPPARFFAPVLPMMAVPAAIAWTRIERSTTRVLAGAGIAATMMASAILVGIDRGRLAFNTREAPALWLEWMGRLADLTTAAPLWSRDTDVPLFRAIAVWAVVMIAVWGALRAIDRRGWLRGRGVANTVGVAALAVACMVAASIVWAFEGASGRNIVPSQLRLLEAVAAERRVLAMALDEGSHIPAGDVAGRLRLALTRPTSTRPIGRETPPMFTLPPLPAGTYRLSVMSSAPRGWVMIGIARDQFALRTIQLPAAPFDLTFPLPVRGLLVRGDEDARGVVEGLLVEPIRIFRSSERLAGDMARRAVRYADTTAFFLDDRSFPEPEAFWIGGARSSTVALQADAARPTVRLVLRNGPVDNDVTLEAGGWRRSLRMQRQEEQHIEVPLLPASGAALLTVESKAGFRPSDVDPASRDQRFLGVWIKVDP
jgi:hypothetical protein